MLDLMLELLSAGDHEAEAHAMTGGLSSDNPNQAALEPPDLHARLIARARATRRCEWAAAVALRRL